MRKTEHLPLTHEERDDYNYIKGYKQQAGEDVDCMQIKEFYSKKTKENKWIYKKFWVFWRLTRFPDIRKKFPANWIHYFAVWFLFLLMTSNSSNASYYSEYVSIILKNHTKSACHGEYLNIVCPEGTSIQIQNAMYGRKVPSSEMCTPPREVASADEYDLSGEDNFEEDINCEAVTSFEKTAADCQGHRLCQLIVHNRVFGEDPCPGTSKYLTVQYKCAPGSFQHQSSCVSQSLAIRCRQETVIAIYDVTLADSAKCKTGERNNSNCSMTSEDIVYDVSTACHNRTRCDYTPPQEACFNHIKIIHACVPRQYLTSELPSSVRQVTTTVTSRTTTHYITEETTAIESTVTSLTSSSDDTTTEFITNEATTVFEAVTGNTTKLQPESTTNSSLLDYGVTVSVANVTFKLGNEQTTANYSADDVIISVGNDFPMKPKMNHASPNLTLLCPNCTNNGSLLFTDLINTYLYIHENKEQLLIAILLGVCVALLLTVCALVFPCPCDPKKGKKKSQEQQTMSEDSRQSVEEEYPLPPPVQEDEHENMSLLGSILQRPRSRTISSSNTVHHQINSTERRDPPNITRTSSSESNEGMATCGPNSIFAKICCNCCCTNAPWQRTQRILKRHQGEVYKVTHRCSSSLEGDGEQFRQAYPIDFSRTDEEISANHVIEHHMAPVEQQSVVTPSMTSPVFSSIPRRTNRSLTPEPGQQYRTDVIHHHPRIQSQRSNHSVLSNTQQIPQHSQPTIHPHNHQYHHPHYHYEQYDNHTQHPQHSHHPHYKTVQHLPTDPNNEYYLTQNRTNNASQHYHRQYPGTMEYANYFPPNANHVSSFGEHFVQVVPRRPLTSNARTVELTQARTVDLSGNNSLSRNSWLEIRRSSIYDNSLPRDHSVFDFYQQQIQQQQQQQQLQHELPGSRNLNQYYP